MKKARLTRYLNAVTIKYDNRRTTIAEKEDGYRIIFYRMKTDDDDNYPNLNIIRGKIVQTEIGLSVEASEILLAALAEMFNVKIIKA